MNCQKCEHKNTEDAAFCEECGNKLGLLCASCGADNSSSAKFCRKCGGNLSESNSPSVPEPRDYTPKHLADKILQSKSALEGERKQVTVLFADIKGSMELAERLDPEEWHEILDRFFAILTDGVHRFEGTVNQYTGDGIMALFGAPIAHEDHAQRACYAALHLRETAREYANAVRARHGVPFGVRLGLNSGAVVVGKIGDDLRMDYTAQGHTVGLAQRMEALAESGHICLSEFTHQLVEGYFDVEDLGPTKVKGVSEEIRIFDLNGVGAFRTRLDRSRAMGLSRFVGRDDDIAVLESALQRAISGEGQVVGVVADAGTGKSRLCSEFLDTCRTRGMTILEGRGVSHGASIPMLPMLELWRAFYEIGEQDSPETARAKIAGRLLLLDESFRESLPLLFDLLGISDPANPSPAMDAELRQKKLHGLVKRILHDPGFSTASRVILLEDLHWFDAASDSFLETFIESVPAGRDLWLVNFRPEYQAGWLQRSYYHHLPLQPLGQDAIRELLSDHLGDDPSIASLPESIHERTKGNPFFIEEVVQSLVENGHLTGSHGDYQLTTPIESLDVPPTVQALLAARMDRLSEREKQVLHTASIIGKVFSEELLSEVIANVSSLDESKLSESLSALVKAEFLFEASLYPKLEYSFKHPLTQEVALGSQLKERKVKVHAAVAEALEGAGGNLDERSAEIAQHWAEAEESGRAAGWYRRAAMWAGLSDPRESLKHWRNVRELLSKVENSTERDEVLLEACNEILSLGWRMGGSEEEAAAVFEEGRALTENLDDTSALALMIGRYGLARYSIAGSGADYARYGEEAALLAQHGDDPDVRAAVTTFPAFGYWSAGDGRRALEWSEKVLEGVGSDLVVGKKLVGYSPIIGMYHVRTQSFILQGRIQDAWDHAHEGLRVAEELDEMEVLTWIIWALGTTYYSRGGEAFPLELGRRCLEIAEQLDNESSRMLAHGVLGYGHLTKRDYAAARDSFLESIRVVHEIGSQRAMHPWVLALLAEAELALGATEKALAAAREGIPLAATGGCQQFELEAQLALIAALITSDAPAHQEEIETAFVRINSLVKSSGNRAVAPRIMEMRGRLAAVLNDTTASREFLIEAVEQYDKIGADGHAARLREELEL